MVHTNMNATLPVMMQHLSFSTETLQADCVQSRQTGFMQCFPISTLPFPAITGTVP